MDNQDFSQNADENPLAEFSDHQDLSELFARDPLSLTDQELSAIVREMRQHRQRWMQNEKKAQKKGTKQNHRQTKKGGAQPSIDDIDLDDIQI